MPLSNLSFFKDQSKTAAAAERSIMEKELKQLKLEVSKYRTENEELKNLVKGLNENEEILEDENKKLKESNEDLIKKAESLMSEIEALKCQIDDRSENDRSV